MKRSRIMLLAAAVSACLAGLMLRADPAKGLPPLKVNRSSAPRLEDAKVEAPRKDGKPRADNTSCFVCHGNYQDEALAKVHAEADIGCIRCHGASVAHRNDEDHRTPPDIMYAPDGIDSACAKCHEGHDVPARKVVARWQQKCPAKTSAAQIVCTDCHGEHRMRFRTYWWDKKTREFMPKGAKVAPPPRDAKPGK